MKASNEYARAISARLYERTPKAVLAAIAVSFAMRCADSDEMDNLADAEPTILQEWRTLHKAGIVPQKPPGAPEGGAS